MGFTPHRGFESRPLRSLERPAKTRLLATAERTADRSRHERQAPSWKRFGSADTPDTRSNVAIVAVNTSEPVSLRIPLDDLAATDERARSHRFTRSEYLIRAAHDELGDRIARLEQFAYSG
jgi:hypothetical protein